MNIYKSLKKPPSTFRDKLSRDLIKLLEDILGGDNEHASEEKIKPRQ
jgi:hypothetical protein